MKKSWWGTKAREESAWQRERWRERREREKMKTKDEILLDGGGGGELCGGLS